MRDLSLLAAGFMLLACQAAIGATTRIGPLMPNALLPIVIYLGMAPDVSIARGAMLSFALGLLADSASGNSLGLLTFVHVATLVATRAAGVRLIMRGRVSQVLITAFVAALGALTVIALRSIFRPDEQFEAASTRHWLVSVLAPSLATGAIAPFVFRLVRRIDSLRRRDENASFS
jgi:rod shape-determining protein MreD